MFSDRECYCAKYTYKYVITILKMPNLIKNQNFQTGKQNKGFSLSNPPH